MNHDSADDDEVPHFTCRLQIPDGVAPGVRTLIEQQDISRQLTELLFRKSAKAISLAEAVAERVERNEARIAALEAFQWKATWIGGFVLAVIEFGLRYFFK